MFMHEARESLAANVNKSAIFQTSNPIGAAFGNPRKLLSKEFSGLQYLATFRT
jgi:hypothetical protein